MSPLLQGALEVTSQPTWTPALAPESVWGEPTRDMSIGGFSSSRKVCPCSDSSLKWQQLGPSFWQVESTGRRATWADIMFSEWMGLWCRAGLLKWSHAQRLPETSLKYRFYSAGLGGELKSSFKQPLRNADAAGTRTTLWVARPLAARSFSNEFYPQECKRTDRWDWTLH